MFRISLMLYPYCGFKFEMSKRYFLLRFLDDLIRDVLVIELSGANSC